MILIQIFSLLPLYTIRKKLVLKLIQGANVFENCDIVQFRSVLYTVFRAQYVCERHSMECKSMLLFTTNPSPYLCGIFNFFVGWFFDFFRKKSCFISKRKACEVLYFVTFYMSQNKKHNGSPRYCAIRAAAHSQVKLSRVRFVISREARPAAALRIRYHAKTKCTSSLILQRTVSVKR